MQLNTASIAVVEDGSNQPLASFDWHPFEENRLLLVNPHGQKHDLRLFERISLVSTSTFD